MAVFHVLILLLEKLLQFILKKQMLIFGEQKCPHASYQLFKTQLKYVVYSLKNSSLMKELWVRLLLLKRESKTEGTIQTPTKKQSVGVLSTSCFKERRRLWIRVGIV